MDHIFAKLADARHQRRANTVFVRTWSLTVLR